MSFNQRKVSANRVFQHIVAAVNFAGFFAFRQRRAVARWGKNGAKTCARSLNASGQVPLRDQFQLHFAAAIQVIENLWVDLAWEWADHFAYAPGLQQRREADFAVSGVVIDNGQVTCALFNQRINQQRRLPGGPKAADHNGRPIVDTRDGIRQRRHTFINHQVAPRCAVIALIFVVRTKCDLLNDAGQGR